MIFNETSTNEANDAIKIIQNAARTYDIKINCPEIIKLRKNSKIADWKAEIDKDCSDYGKPMMYVLFLSRNEEKFYHEIKDFLSTKVQIPSQIVLRKTLDSKNRSKALSAASKIILQMVAKLGYPIWEIQH